jgi:RNA polymerase sigma-70 factor (ECF subfamily)
MSNEQREQQSFENDRVRDRERVRRVLVGDQDAFREIYESYFRRVYAYTLKHIGDPFEAEDLTQETFVQLYRSLESYEGRSSLLTWIFGIAHNLCSRYFRHCSRWMVGPTNQTKTTRALDQRSVESTIERHIEAVRVLDRCDRVLASSRRPAHQEIFHLRYGQSHSIRAIAEKVGKTKDAVKVSLRRSRAVLAAAVPGLAVVLDNVAQSA